jgi:molybdopterin-binding protein
MVAAPLITQYSDQGVTAMPLSARNQIPARVTAIHNGEAISNVELDANGTRLVASITVEAVQQLGLSVGSQVTAVIKASDVILATD